MLITRHDAGERRLSGVKVWEYLYDGAPMPVTRVGAHLYIALPDGSEASLDLEEIIKPLLPNAPINPAAAVRAAAFEHWYDFATDRIDSARSFIAGALWAWEHYAIR